MMLPLRKTIIRCQQTLLGVMGVIIQPIINTVILMLAFGVLLRTPSEQYLYMVYLFRVLIV